MSSRAGARLVHRVAGQHHSRRPRATTRPGGGAWRCACAIMPLAAASVEGRSDHARHVDVLDRARRAVGEETLPWNTRPGWWPRPAGRRFSDFEPTCHLLHPSVYRPRDADDDEDRQVRGPVGVTRRGPSTALRHDRRLDAAVGLHALAERIPAAHGRPISTPRMSPRPPTGSAAGPCPLSWPATTRQRRSDAMYVDGPSAPPPTTATLGPSNFMVTVHGSTDLVARLLDVPASMPSDTRRRRRLRPRRRPRPHPAEPESIHELDDGTVITVNTLLLALLTGTVRGYPP